MTPMSLSYKELFRLETKRLFLLEQEEKNRTKVSNLLERLDKNEPLFITLDLNFRIVRGSDFILFMQKIAKHTHLRKLILSDYCFLNYAEYPERWDQFCQALLENTSIQQLGLANCNLFQLTLPQCAKWMTVIKARKEPITHLDLSNNNLGAWDSSIWKEFHEAFYGNSTLIEVQLSENRLGRNENNFKILCQTIATFRKLNILRLDNDLNISNRETLEISNHLPNFNHLCEAISSILSLKTLTLMFSLGGPFHTGIIFNDHRVVMQFYRILSDHPSLTHIDLARNECLSMITGTYGPVWEIYCNDLLQKPKLHSLHLHRGYLNRISDRQWTTYCEAVYQHTTLLSMDYTFWCKRPIPKSIATQIASDERTGKDKKSSKDVAATPKTLYDLLIYKEMNPNLSLYLAFCSVNSLPRVLKKKLFTYLYDNVNEIPVGNDKTMKFDVLEKRFLKYTDRRI